MFDSQCIWHSHPRSCTGPSRPSSSVHFHPRRPFGVRASIDGAIHRPFRKSVLPRQSKSCAYPSEFKPIYPIAKLHPIDLVIVADQETAGQTKRTGFYYLLGGPFRSWMSGHAKTKESPSPEAQDKKHVEIAECRRWHDGEIDCKNLVRVISQKRCPSLSGAGWRRELGRVARNRDLGCLDAQLE